MLKKIVPFIICIPFVLGISGCASNIGSNEYSTGQVGEATHTYQGVIISKRIVKVEGNTTSELLGTVGGAAAGGVLGSFIGGGTGRTVATIGGAALGGIAGNEAGRKLSEQEAYEYTVRLDRDDSLRTVVQGADVDLPVGLHVFVQVSSQGRSRIMPDGTGTGY